MANRMNEMVPTVGRIVYYKLSESDADQINKRREDYGKNPKTAWPIGAQAHVGNRVEAGQIYPMIIVRVWEGDAHGVNGQVLLDGNDIFWATSVSQGEGGHEWDWMPFQKDQQKRVEAMADAEIEERKEDSATKKIMGM